MDDSFQTFLADPTLESFLQARAEVLQSDAYQPHSPVLAELDALLEAGCFEDVRGQATSLLPAWRLSPRVHFFAGVAADQLGDLERAKQERIIMQACLQGLLSTGNGSPQRAYLVTHTSDEYDVLQALQQRAVGQKLLETGQGQFDVITCHDGDDLWFDVTEVLQVCSRPKPESKSRYETDSKTPDKQAVHAAE